MNEKSRTWNLILYPKEDDSHYNALEYIKNNYIDYAYIIHDKDTNNKNELKKEHIHITIQFHNARYRNAIALELGITPNYMQKCISLENSLTYLIHYGLKNKYQYDIEEVHGNLKYKLIKILETIDISEEDKLSMIIDYISRYNAYLTYTAFTNYIITTPLLQIYKKYNYIINQIIYEHNIYYSTYSSSDNEKNS